MIDTHTLDGLTEPDVRRLAEEIAFAVRPGDLIALEGDLGAGKTTLARALIRAVMGEAAEDIPSPTFTLVQSYDTARLRVAHFDLYRLGDASELDELGLDDALATGIALVEWPERAGDRLPVERLAVRLAITGDGLRRATLTGTGGWQSRLDRLVAMHQLIREAGFTAPDTSLAYFQGDASPRRYARLAVPIKPGGSDNEASSAILMDAPRQPDGPPIRNGLPYSRIAHLAEDVRPFLALARHLAGAGLSAPRILANDIPHGLLVIEDLGDRVYGRELQRGASQAALWRAAVEPLLVLRTLPAPDELPVGDRTMHRIPLYDRGAMQIEIELLLDWMVPALTEAPAAAAMREEFLSRWSQIFDRLLALPTGLVLRDYHSPNLIALPERLGAASVGIIDFQDAMRGHEAYDLVSLLQDARLDVPAGLERDLFAYYCKAACAADPAFDHHAFAFAYAALGAQRNTKILGIFARLAKRDGKPQYLAHIPRIWGYLARDLEAPGLASLKAWYDLHLPPALRERAITAGA